jgi:hypothetical protein
LEVVREKPRAGAILNLKTEGVVGSSVAAAAEEVVIIVQLSFDVRCAAGDRGGHEKKPGLLIDLHALLLGEGARHGHGGHREVHVEPEGPGALIQASDVAGHKV